MKNETLKKIIMGVAIIALGVLLALYGPTEVLRLYFGIAACVIGGAFVVYGLFLLSRKLSVPSFAFIAGGALVAIGVGFLVGRITTEIFEQLIVFAVLGIGSGLTLYGIYLIAQKVNFASVTNLAGGVATLTFAILYLIIDKFSTIFWIIIGILIALYGLFTIVMLFIPKKDKEVDVKEVKEDSENEAEKEESEEAEESQEEAHNEEEGD